MLKEVFWQKEYTTRKLLDLYKEINTGNGINEDKFIFSYILSFYKPFTLDQF